MHVHLTGSRKQRPSASSIDTSGYYAIPSVVPLSQLTDKVTPSPQGPEVMPGIPQETDILIVGAGTAGCVLANRLSADPAISVAVLEAGGDRSQDARG